ncbi:hypothetical protein JMJ77_0000819 [Colletotrichum scovillei]|uniref:Uncharacterized protein n=1 Tax=Colletotrichum scovillei TaxID=1209932 RepID=A0A9P7UHP8_9PEZI|nr:hypothetical protein JMJ77_0000819 [Colletotrichum scovillei]KAG7072033.1 hypothetical protein JMJ76_0004895 [Colletotrichum scovillei]KAG7080273.1 hypothetical protein JMJ78_0007371 [Colletotrichum scovillei]
MLFSYISTSCQSWIPLLHQSEVWVWGPKKAVVNLWTCCQCGQHGQEIRVECCRCCGKPRCAYCPVSRVRAT